jgi:hypothetical protein
VGCAGVFFLINSRDFYRIISIVISVWKVEGDTRIVTELGEKEIGLGEVGVGVDSKVANVKELLNSPSFQKISAKLQAANLTPALMIGTTNVVLLEVLLEKAGVDSPGDRLAIINSTRDSNPNFFSMSGPVYFKNVDRALSELDI